MESYVSRHRKITLYYTHIIHTILSKKGLMFVWSWKCTVCEKRLVNLHEITRSQHCLCNQNSSLKYSNNSMEYNIKQLRAITHSKHAHNESLSPLSINIFRYDQSRADKSPRRYLRFTTIFTIAIVSIAVNRQRAKMCALVNNAVQINHWILPTEVVQRQMYKLLAMFCNTSQTGGTSIVFEHKV